MSDINMGTLYDINKTAVAKEKPLSEKEIDEKLVKVTQLCISSKNTYWMLLNRERSDFTLFNFSKRYIVDIVCLDLKECLQNRGEIISIDLTKDGNAYEIWLSIINEDYHDTKETFVYYFFPYDEGVIE